MFLVQSRSIWEPKKIITVSVVMASKEADQKTEFTEQKLGSKFHLWFDVREKGSVMDKSTAYSLVSLSLKQYKTPTPCWSSY